MTPFRSLRTRKALREDQDRIADLERQRDELLEALRPFAAEAAGIAFLGEQVSDDERISVRVGDLRKARAAIASVEKPGEGSPLGVLSLTCSQRFPDQAAERLRLTIDLFPKPELPNLFGQFGWHGDDFSDCRHSAPSACDTSYMRFVHASSSMTLTYGVLAAIC